MEFKFKKQKSLMDLIEAFRGPKSELAVETFIELLEPVIERAIIQESKVIKEEYDYLLWLRNNSDFGPASGDVHAILEEDYTKETGKKVPKALSWSYDE